MSELCVFIGCGLVLMMTATGQKRQVAAVATLDIGKMSFPAMWQQSSETATIAV
jgi:hypothetical protein